MTELDTTPVSCPNGCLLSGDLGPSLEVPREFRWCEAAGGDIGTRRHCERCGEKLEEAEQ